MNGQDILSAALDQCGLGDLFSTSPVISQNESIEPSPIVSGQVEIQSERISPISVINPQNENTNQTFPTSSVPIGTTSSQAIETVPMVVRSVNNNQETRPTLSIPYTQPPLQINKIKKIIIRKVASNAKPTTQGITTINGNTIKQNIVTLNNTSSCKINGNAILTTKQNPKKIVTIQGNKVNLANSSVNTSLAKHPIRETMESSNVVSSKNVIIKNSSPIVSVVKPLTQPSSTPNTTVSINNPPKINGSQMVQLIDGKIFQLNGPLTTIGNNDSANRVITIKTIRSPLAYSKPISSQHIQLSSLSAPTSPVSPAVITNVSKSIGVSATISNGISSISNGASTPLSAPPVLGTSLSLPQNLIPTIVNKSLISKSNATVIGRRINGKNVSTSSSDPSSPKTSCNSIISTPEANQEEQIDRAIMLEEVRRLIEDQEEEEFANLETFADYMPAKLRIGNRHPDLIVETASLSSIPPPDVYYRLSIPDEVIDDGRLSALQLESIIYASQQHENILPDGCRSGFLIGDGAGVGKGRTVAGIIFENYLHGRKRSLWFSVSTDLKYDAERDLNDIGAGKIEVHLLNKFKYGYKIHTPENDNVKRGVIFSTYNSLIGESTSVSGKYSTRFNQIIQWCGEDFDGVIIFDECHKAKNLFPSGTTRATKTGQMVLELQRRLPKARVVYASATGATEPKNMGYMTRLGIWGPGTPFDDFNHFVQTVEKRGVGAMELVAIDLKMRGMYVARQLSFKGVSFRIEHVPLSREFIRIYNCCCRLWVSAKIKFEKALDLMGADPQVSKSVWTQFWAAHQRFFKYLCIASKVKFAVAFVKEALRCNKSIVIGLQSTGEARTLEALDDNGGELNDFVSTAKSVFQSLIEKHFPAPNRKKLAKILGNDTSFFDQFGIKLSRNDRDEIVVSSFDENYDESIEEAKNRVKKAQSFFDSENESESDDFVDVDDYDQLKSKDTKESSDSSDIDSDDLDDIDEIMDEKLGLKSKNGFNGKSSNAIKFMDILLGPSSASSKRKAKSKKRSKAPVKKQKLAKPKKSMKSKYEKFYNGYEKVSEDVGGYCEHLRDELVQQLESFGERLPPNTLDELIDELGGPENVAEMTGRKGRVVSTEEGLVQYEARTDNDVSLEMLNLVEKQRFMDDDKRVAIISEAASSGISLHADRRVKNRWRRVHITVELPWSADRAIQQFGRTHRSNQVSAPEYVFLISNLAGEKRFASIVAKRLESLGALTHGDRRATESRDLSQFNIDTKYGRQALEIVMKTIIGSADANPLVSTPEYYNGDFFEDCREGLAGVGIVTIDRKSGSCILDKDHGNINKFLNRLLGLEVHLQNALFSYFNDTMEAVIKRAKRTGKYDSGIIDLSSDVGNVQKLNEENFIMKSSSGATKIQLHTVSIDRGLHYEKAINMYQQAIEEDDYFKDDIGFYVSSSTYQVRKTIFLAIPEVPSKNQDVKQIFRIYKPSAGLQSKYETKSSLRDRGTKLSDMKEIETIWSEHYEQSESKCSHMLLFGRCKAADRHAHNYPNNGLPTDPLLHIPNCDFGIRKRTYCILSGSVLTVWPEIEKMIPHIQSHKLQIVRLKTDDGKKYIGPMVPQFFVGEVRNCLHKLANNP